MHSFRTIWRHAPRRVAAGVLLGVGLMATAWADLDHYARLSAGDREVNQAMMQWQHATNHGEGFGGHRQRALRLLAQARQEIREAAHFADHHRN